MYLPTWAVSAFGVVFFAVAALAGWALRSVGGKLQEDVRSMKATLSGVADKAQVEKIGDKVDCLDKRLVRVETLLNGTPKNYTPPIGVPMATD
jgi:hypothetical protein